MAGNENTACALDTADVFLTRCVFLTLLKSWKYPLKDSVRQVFLNGRYPCRGCFRRAGCIIREIYVKQVFNPCHFLFYKPTSPVIWPYTSMNELVPSLSLKIASLHRVGPKVIEDVNSPEKVLFQGKEVCPVYYSKTSCIKKKSWLL
jgi:hypothetical protein